MHFLDLICRRSGTYHRTQMSKRQPVFTTRNVELTNTVSCLLKTSIAPITRTQYECGYSGYVIFLSMTGVLWTNSYMPPLTEESLIHFASHCFKNVHLKCSISKMYICGIRYTYLESGKKYVFSNASDKLYLLA